MERTGAIIAAAHNAAGMRREMGAAALEMDAAPDGSAQAQWRATVSARLPSQRWPQQPMLIVAVDAHTGEPVVFDRHGGVELADAVAASCANGFGVPPYTIGERRYIDGGYRANENADLAAGYARVLVLSPLGGRIRGIRWSGAPISQRRPANYAHVAAGSKPSSRIATLKTHSALASI